GQLSPRPCRRPAVVASVGQRAGVAQMAVRVLVAADRYLQPTDGETGHQGPPGLVLVAQQLQRVQRSAQSAVVVTADWQGPRDPEPAHGLEVGIVDLRE